MFRRFPIVVSLIALAVTGGTVAVNEYNAYTHPDLAGRTTEDLSCEAISLVVDHTEEPFFMQLARFRRQDFISQELRNRQVELLARLQANDPTPVVAVSGE